jgi:hypothetical protein
MDSVMAITIVAITAQYDVATVATLEPEGEAEGNGMVNPNLGRVCSYIIHMCCHIGTGFTATTPYVAREPSRV